MFCARYIHDLRKVLQDREKAKAWWSRLYDHQNYTAQHSIHRLELTVMTHNEAGIALYRRPGFEIEGVKKQSLLMDGQYVDEYYMAKLLE
jgi:RimJ/RimL family protein N-acetyltransferase